MEGKIFFYNVDAKSSALGRVTFNYLVPVPPPLHGLSFLVPTFVHLFKRASLTHTYTPTQTSLHIYILDPHESTFSLGSMASIRVHWIRPINDSYFVGGGSRAFIFFLFIIVIFICLRNPCTTRRETRPYSAAACFVVCRLEKKTFDL